MDPSQAGWVVFAANPNPCPSSLSLEDHMEEGGNRLLTVIL